MGTIITKPANPNAAGNAGSRTCNLCETEPAVVDAATGFGPWAYLCPGCLFLYGTSNPQLITNITERDLELEVRF